MAVGLTLMLVRPLGAAAAATGGHTEAFVVTFCASPDNDAPGTTTTACPAVHQHAGGTGTFADPMTPASDRYELPVGTVVHSPAPVPAVMSSGASAVESVTGSESAQSPAPSTSVAPPAFPAAPTSFAGSSPRERLAGSGRSVLAPMILGAMLLGLGLVALVIAVRRSTRHR
ncbi:hypothetical protein AB0K51_31565 [Kitasatospora sp. NPDC049285]|uniref:hypothetical protein n=1 Tax=Kitasatospora sp. NPDC049285 TaxID=3157096 RepID=UPI003419B669